MSKDILREIFYGLAVMYWEGILSRQTVAVIIVAAFCAEIAGAGFATGEELDPILEGRFREMGTQDKKGVEYGDSRWGCASLDGLVLVWGVLLKTASSDVTAEKFWEVVRVSEMCRKAAKEKGTLVFLGV